MSLVWKLQTVLKSRVLLSSVESDLKLYVSMQANYHENHLGQGLPKRIVHVIELTVYTWVPFNDGPINKSINN